MFPVFHIARDHRADRRRAVGLDTLAGGHSDVSTRVAGAGDSVENPFEFAFVDLNSRATVRRAV